MSTNHEDRRLRLRSHVVLAVVAAACSCATPKSDTIVGVSTVTSASVGRQPLLSWVDGPNRRAIVDFVRRVSGADSPGLVPAEERIAVFDNNGTLWPEKPLPQAAFVAALVPAPARVLDAGCGTGRAAVRLDELGYDVVGVDVDAAMLEQARAAAPELDWRLGDLASFDLDETFDVVLVAGNTIPLLEPGTLADACARLAAHAAPGGVVVVGFGLDSDHLPGDCPVTPLDDVDAAMAAAGLVPEDRHGTWAGGPFEGGYVVATYRRPA